MRITALELIEQIAEIDEKLLMERAALRNQQAKIRDLKQAREIKASLLKRLEQRGIDSIELPG